MEYIYEAFAKALQLITALDNELLAIVLLSLEVSLGALCIASLAAIPLGVAIGLRSFPLRGLVLSIVNTCVGLPPVVVGLFVFLFLSRSGPLGGLGLLYTPTAMVVAQIILAFPIIVSLVQSAVSGVDPMVRLTALTLGATPQQADRVVVREAGTGIIAALVAGYGRLAAEVGAILIVGGNIAGATRVMTTTIAMEADKGNFELALALGIILLSISLMINAVLSAMQQRGMRRNL
ncbi:MAG: tungstate transport system permease protein [Nitrospirae bacterium]|nr:MAG: tungstate transport system permease protein [Nitrospirota bacterium]